MENQWSGGGGEDRGQCEKVGFGLKTHLFAKGTRKKLAMEQEKLIRNHLVVYDRK